MKRKKSKAINTQRIIFRVFLTTVTITLLLLSAYLLQLYFCQKNSPPPKAEPVLGAATEVGRHDQAIVYWQDYLIRFPKYFPGWLELAKLESDNGDFQVFTGAIKKAESLNPNSEDVQQLKFQYGL